MRDFSHGPARREKVKDFGDFRMKVDYRLKAMTGMGWRDFGFTDSDIRGVMDFSAQEAAELLVHQTDYQRTTPGALDLAEYRLRRHVKG